MIPPLTLSADPGAPNGVSLHFAEAEGMPLNGLNLLELPFVDAGIDPARVVVESMLVVISTYYEGNLVIDSTVQGAASTKVFVDPVSGLTTAISPDRRFLALTFDQQGADEVRVQVQLIKTEIK